VLPALVGDWVIADYAFNSLISIKIIVLAHCVLYDKAQIRNMVVRDITFHRLLKRIIKKYLPLEIEI